MKYGLTEFYTAMMSVNTFSMIILLISVKKSNTLSREKKILFSLIFVLVGTAGACEWLGVLMDGHGGIFRYFHVLVKAMQFSISPMIPTLFCWIVSKSKVKLSVTLVTIHTIIEIVSMKFGFIFYIDEENLYRHGDGYWIYFLAYSLSIIFALLFLFVNTQKFQYQAIGQYIMIACMIMFDVMIQLQTHSIRVIYIGLGMGASILYITILEMIQQTDGLTGLLSRLALNNYIDSHNKKCEMLFFDVDSFKFINDTYGHEYGDIVLVDIAEAIRKTYVSYGKCYRYGGDEFCVILTKSIDRVEELNESFSSCISKLQETDNRIPEVSVGHTEFNPKVQTMREALEQADKAMYDIKGAKKKWKFVGGGCMISKILGNYLVSKGKITSEQLTDALSELKKVRVKLGLIAVAEGMITQEQADEVNRLQAVMDKRFGDIAVSKKYLTEKQVDELLKLQGNPYLSFAQSLENLNLLKMDELDEIVKEYQAENDLTNSEIEDLKSDDVDRVIPLYLPSDAAEYTELAGMALRTIIRCVDNSVMPLKAYFDTKCLADNGAMQSVKGEKTFTVAFAGNGRSILTIASSFGHEEFKEVNEDALDAVAELINCINGLFASKLSEKRIETTLYPPEYSASIGGFYCDKMLVVPIEVLGSTVQILLNFGSSIEMR